METPKIKGTVCGIFHQKRDPELLKGLSPVLTMGDAVSSESQAANKPSDEL